MRHLPLTAQVNNLNQTLRGHYAYYGIAGNFQSLHQVYERTVSYWHKMQPLPCIAANSCFEPDLAPT